MLFVLTISGCASVVPIKSVVGLVQVLPVSHRRDHIGLQSGLHTTSHFIRGFQEYSTTLARIGLLASQFDIALETVSFIYNDY
jgi:hypothetical protein